MSVGHWTEQPESGTLHHWEHRSEQGAVVMTLHATRDLRTFTLVPDLFHPTESGAWQFYGIGVHQSDGPDPGFCPLHDSSCSFDALDSDRALQVWGRLREVGVTDRAVYAELKTLAALLFEEAV